MKPSRSLTTLLLTLLLSLQLNAQHSFDKFFDEGGGERYFRFKVENPAILESLNHIISIDNFDGESVTAWASREAFAIFDKYGFDVEFLPLDSGFEPVMHGHNELEQLMQWNSYPTYEAYEAMMYQFQSDYPGKCIIHNIGTLNSGRKLLGAQIKVNNQPKPQFLYSSTMHGDELTGFVLSLRLIDYLLSNYGSDPFITRLVDSVEIWIFPAANPDGTYRGGNHTVMNSRRGNANNVDLNRNFPDPKAGPNPDGNVWQPETIAFMSLAENNNFRIGANMHGGAEVCNYPWDTWSRLTADNAWWVNVTREYADTAQLYSPPGYMSQFNSGITNGYAWYSITGGRQDYMNFFNYCREFTLEISDVKKLPASQLDAHWEYNYRSFLNYIEQALYGVRGTVTDAVTGDPVRAKVFITGHDIDSSHVYSVLPQGHYNRYLNAGTYNITFSSPCHYPLTISGVSASNRNTTWLDVQLIPLPATAEFAVNNSKITPGQIARFSDMSCGAIQSWEWSFPGGVPAFSSDKNPMITYPVSGEFDVSLTVSDGVNSSTILKENFMIVAPHVMMANAVETTCLSIFYDSGGPGNNYSNNENFIITFQPSLSGAKMQMEFTLFDIEQSVNCNYDFMKIYDGSSTTAPLLGTWCGTNSPGIVEAANDGGSLTVHFKSDGSMSRPGWEAIVRCLAEQIAPVANFTVNATQIFEGDTIYFQDISLGNPTSWEWIFEGGVPPTSTVQHPMVVYPEAGVYQVTLIVQNSFGGDYLIKENFITVDTGVGLYHPIRETFFVAYPNPVKDGMLQIRSESEIRNLRLMNLSGQLMVIANPEANNFSLDVGDLNPGIYFLKVVTSKSSGVLKVLIQ
jgi:PKD repeat protein